MIHKSVRLLAVEVRGYNAELRDRNGLIGDRAGKRGFHAILDDWRKGLSGQHGDPLGDLASSEIRKKTLDKVLTKGELEAAGLVLGAV